MNKWIKNWFSNFEPFDEPYIYQGISFKYPETFYQAMKVDKYNKSIREHIASLSPSNAKKFWRTNKNKEKYQRKDWFEVNLEIMEFILRVKFLPGTSWYQRLMKEDGEIVETNNWHDNFYGACVCDRCSNKVKYNHLGKILMKIRDEKVKDSQD
jgi:predicted NAD-dependent protein-ADP-ribosyltransferase YbiA (DUF1768 family)